MCGASPERSASWCSEQPSPAAKPGRLRKMQAPSTTRVLSSPSSSSVQPPLRLRPSSRNCQVSAVSRLTVASTRSTSSSSVKWAPRVQQPSDGPVGVDAGAARAVDAGPRRGQPGDVAAEPLRQVGFLDLLGVVVEPVDVDGRFGPRGVHELDPGAGNVQRDLGHDCSLGRLRYGSRMRLGVLDIGSNTVHLLVVDAHPGARPLPAYSHKVSLRLAEYLVDGQIATTGATRPRRDRHRRDADRRGPGRAGGPRLRHERDPRGAQRRGGPGRRSGPAPARRCRCCPARTRRG